MAITGLNLPTDIPWERVCVTTDMVDPGQGQSSLTPPLWQSSMALYRFVPPAEFQTYAGRRIIYYKLAATITNYWPKKDQILGSLDVAGLNTGDVRDEEIKRRLGQSLPCSAAIVQVTVTPREQGRDLQEYPYFLDVQPRQRALYEQVNETKERASRSHETLQLRKDAGSSNSLEVLDVDKGGSIQGGFAGASAGASRQMERGVTSLGKEDSSNVTTTDASREARETLAFTTQLSQMYTLLQAYHLGTNRVFFYITPRPHAVEPPTGIAGPRKLDGVQDLFLVVSQAEEDALPCITARLDTGHLAIRPVFGFDTSTHPPRTERVVCPAPAPLEDDPLATATTEGSGGFYGCFFKSVSKQGEITAPAGFVIDKDNVDVETRGHASFPNTTKLTYLPDRPNARKVIIDATATGYACHRNTEGDVFEAVLNPFGLVVPEAQGNPPTKHAQPGIAICSVSVTFRSELPTVKTGDEHVLTLTTRELQCCDGVAVTPAKIVDIVAVLYVGAAVASTAPPTLDVLQGYGKATPAPTSTPSTPGVSVPISGAPGTTTSNAPAPPAAAPPTATFNALAMTLAQANDLQQRLAAETLRLSGQIDDVGAAPARDGEFVLHSLLGSVLDDSRRARTLRADAETLGLADGQLDRVAEGLGRAGERPSRFDVMLAPDQVLQEATGRCGADLMRLRLEAAGLPTVADAYSPDPGGKDGPSTGRT